MSIRPKNAPDGRATESSFAEFPKGNEKGLDYRVRAAIRTPRLTAPAGGLAAA